MINILSPRKKLLSPNEQGADFVELFFDLVFVYAITRITSLTAHDLDMTHVLQSALVFWLIWWAWTQFTWSLNVANTKIAEVRLYVLIATVVAFLMATQVDQAFSSRVIWFVLPYIIIRLIGLVLYIRVTTSPDGKRSAAWVYTLISLTGLIAVLIGALVGPNLRIGLWIAAIVLDLLAASLGANVKALNVLPKHFAERHGLIVIIALGESLIVAAAAITGQEMSQDLMIAGGLAVLITGLLWWSYFAWIHEYIEESFSKKPEIKQTGYARDAYSFLHFPLIGGIIGIAIGFEKILHHPSDLLSQETAMALGIGVILFIASTAASLWRMSNLLLVPRLIILVISSVALALLVGHPPQYALGLFFISLILIVLIEWKYYKHNTNEVYTENHN